MTDTLFSFECSRCGEVHEGSPSVAFDAPWHHAQLNGEEKARARLTSDTCVIPHEKGTDRFVRTLLEIPIHDIAEPFLWGVWVSLSEASFERYLATWDEPVEEDSYFGWFCNRLPYYPETIGLKTRVRPRAGNLRPSLELEPTDHPLSEHFHRGLTLELAREIFERVLHPAAD